MKFKKQKNNLSITIIALIIVFFAGFVLWSNFNKPVSADWYNTLWQYRQKITIDKTKVGGGTENETNFPILVSITEPKLIKGAQASGNDIMFTDSDGITKLSHEIESYNSQTGQLIAWVKVPTLTYQTNNVLYMYYGSASSPSQQNATDVWSNGFAAVYHLKETGTNPTVYDSTGVNNSTSQTWTPTTSGQIGGGGSFNGTSNYINLGTGDWTKLTSPFTVSLWFKTSSVASQSLLSKYRGVSGTNGYATLIWDNAVFRIEGNQGSWTPLTYDNGSWHFISGISASNVDTFVDGALRSSTVRTNTPDYSTNLNLYIGAVDTSTLGTPTSYYNGLIDEVRISSTARSAGWISTEYNNQNSPSTFLTLSSTQEKTKAPVLNWKFDEGLGTTVNSPAGTINWYNSLWSYRKKLTIDHTKVGSGAENETNFPVLVSLTGLSNINTNGTDIRFTSSDGVTELPREIESYSGGTLVAWVKVPTLSYTTDTVLYMYYGNSSATEPSASSTYGSQNVWTNSYAGVWHFPNGTTLTANDSTSNGNNGTITGATASSGQIDGGASFSSSGHNINTPLTTINNQTAGTISTFVKANSITDGIITAKQHINVDSMALTMIGRNSQWGLGDAGRIYFKSRNTSPLLSSDTTISAGSWYKIDVAYSSSGATVYINGVAHGTASGDFTVPNDLTAENCMLGSWIQSGSPIATLNGYLDETKISSITRSAGWIATEYNNQNSPSTFMTAGNQEQNVGWQTQDQCVSGKCLLFSNTSISPSANIQNVQSIGFWIKPTTTTQSVLDLDGGTHTITISSGTISANGFSSPTIYVNGKVSSTVSANTWSYIEITTGTTFTATTGMTLGKVSSTYFSGYIDEFKIYDYARTAAEVKSDYNAGSVKSAPTQTGLSNGLVGYWKMDESSGSAIDSSGNGNTGTWNGTGANHYTSGKFGNGGGFNGSDDYISVPANSFTRGSPVSISAWFKTSSGSSGIFGWGNYGIRFDVGGYSITSGKLGIGLFTTGDGGSYIWTKSTTSVNDNVWHLGTATYDNKTLNLYVDGKLEGTMVAPMGGPILYNGSSGGIGLSYVYYATGSMDELRIYNRALSASEITQLYNYAPGPIAQYNFDEGSGTAVSDSSGYGNTGTWSGTGNHWTNGKFGKAGSFNGSNDYVELPYNSIRDFGTSNFTINTWIRMPNQANRPIIEWGTYNANGFLLRTNEASPNAVSVYINNSRYEWTYAFSPNVWHNLVLERNSSTTIELFINGISQGAKTISSGTTVTAGGGVTRIGKITSGGVNDGNFSGQIDQVKIYNYARTQAQIIADMGTSMTQTRPQTTKNPVGYWKFDEGSGTVAKDLSGNGNNGTITGAVWNNDGKFGKALQFDGNNDLVSVSNSISSQTVSMWINPTTTTQPLITLASGVSVSASSGTIAATGFTSPTIYVNGKLGSVISVANRWNHIVIVDTAQTTANAITIGKATTYFSGLIDEVKIYNYALTSDEVKQDYNRGQSIMLGSTGVASNSASAAYCIPGDTSPCSAPVAEYNFEEGSGTTVKDTSGNNNNGTWSGTGSHWVNGKVGKGGQFNGSNDYVTISNPTGANLSSLTISAWVYGNTYTLQRDIIDSGLGGYQFVIANGGTIYLYKSGNLQVVASSTVLNTNRWYYVTVTYDGSVGKIYIDGVLNSSASVSTTFTPSVWVIGNYSYGGQVFNGKIDQLKIYNYARTAAQVAWDYNKGAPVAHWKMDECTGTTIHDISGNGNNGTLTNATAGDCNTNASTAWYNGRVGKFGASIKLDGSDDYITAGNAPALRTMESNLWTLSAWIYPSSDATSFFGATKGSDATNYMIFYNNNSKMQVNATGASPSLGAFNSTNTCINLNSWNHVVFEMTTSGIVMYCNGVLQTVSIISGTNRQSSWSTNSFDTLIIGGYKLNNTYSGLSNGKIDDVQIYNYALTATQVKMLYNNNAAVRM